MSQEIYKKFLSGGFEKLNSQSSGHIINLYRYNYSQYLSQDKKAKILDVGCGMGHFLQFLAQAGYDDYLGVDISDQSIRYCQEKGIAKVRLINSLSEYLNMCPMFDLIVLNDVIEHFPKEEILDILKKIYQKLNVNGKIIIKTGNMSSLAGLRIRYNDFTHEAGFTEYSLNQVLHYCDFQEINIFPYLYPKNKITRVVRFIFQKIIHFFWRAMYFFEYTEPPKIVDELICAVARK